MQLCVAFQSRVGNIRPDEGMAIFTWSRGSSTRPNEAGEDPRGNACLDADEERERAGLADRKYLNGLRFKSVERPKVSLALAFDCNRTSNQSQAIGYRVVLKNPQTHTGGIIFPIAEGVGRGEN